MATEGLCLFGPLKASGALKHTVYSSSLYSTLDTSHSFSGLINGGLVLHWHTQAGRKSRGPITCEQTARVCTSTEGGGHGAEKTHVKSFCTALLALRKLNLSLFTQLYMYMSCNYNHTTPTRLLEDFGKKFRILGFISRGRLLF